MIDQHTFESLILTNTIVTVFCIVLLITFTVFILVILIPSIRRRWFGTNEKEESQIGDLSSLSRQPSFRNFTFGSSRFNPIFESATDTTTTNQFGTLFHPQASIATLIHPTIWTSITPTSLISSPLTVQSPPTLSTLTKSATAPPPVPSHLPTKKTITTTTVATAQRSPKKR
jgi:hypothetical protein